MKNSIYICISLIVIGLCTACSKHEVYSCDPEIDKWININMDDIRTMTRADWLSVNDISYQRGIYNAFSPDQRINLWIDKIDELLKIKWTKAEYEHLMKLRITVIENVRWFFANLSEAELDNKEIFIYQWNDYAINELMWSNELIYSIAYTPEKIDENKKLIASKRTDSSLVKTHSESGGQMVCDCHNPESAHYFICGINGYDCLFGNCSGTSWGCGWLWTVECNGLCYRVI